MLPINYTATRQDPSTGVNRPDSVALGGINLVFLLAAMKPESVADVFDGLQSDPHLPTALTSANDDLDGDGTPDLSALGVLFVSHGFHPVGNPHRWNDYFLSDPVGQTQPGSSGLTLRRNEDTTPGSAIQLTNGTTEAISVNVDVGYPSTSEHLEVVLAPNADRLVHLELPPYWDPGEGSVDALPDCLAPDPWPVTVTLSAPGIEPMAMSSCEYLHAAATTTTAAAMTYVVGPASTPVATPLDAVPSSGPSAGPSVPVLIIVGALVAAGIAVLAWRATRRTVNKQ
jgi:hypothetical protein